MPTSTEVFAEVAARFGSVDAGDPEAVQRWYEETVPTLKREEIEEILDELLHREGESGGGALPRRYPAEAPLPSLDGSPPAPLPLFLVGSIVFLKNLLARVGGRTEKP